MKTTSKWTAEWAPIGHRCPSSPVRPVHLISGDTASGQVQEIKRAHAEGIKEPGTVVEVFDVHRLIYEDDAP